MSHVLFTRRSFVGGVGALAGIPRLKAARGPARAEARKLVIVYAPNGVYMPAWTPAKPGLLELSPTLDPFRDFAHRCTVVSGFGFAQEMEASCEAGPHSLACAGFLSGVAPLRSEGGLRATVTVDQEAALMCTETTCTETWLPSLQLCCEDPITASDAEPGYGTAALNHLSWRTPSMPLPAEIDLQAAFLRLFRGDAGQWIRNSYAVYLKADREPADQLPLAQYLKGLYDLERRLQGVHALSRLEQMHLAMDMTALALHSGVTRVAVVMLGREKSRATFPELGIAETHHQLSHLARGEAAGEKLMAVDRYYASVTAHLLRSLASFEDGDGSLLDSTMVVYGSGMSDGSAHRHSGLPVLLAGGSPQRPFAGRHRELPQQTDLRALHHALLRWFRGDVWDVEEV